MESKTLRADARERLARWLYLQDNTDEWAARHWDNGGDQHVNKDRWRLKADEVLRVVVQP